MYVYVWCVSVLARSLAVPRRSLQKPGIDARQMTPDGTALPEYSRYPGGSGRVMIDSAIGVATVVVVMAPPLGWPSAYDLCVSGH